ncbi:MAG: hypothetical protein QM754_11090 [Tepidisphaeraceae bacterium]
MRITTLQSMAAFGVLAGLAAAVPAAYVITIQPVGPDIVATGSGSLNTTALTPAFTGSFGAQITPFTGTITIGPASDTPAQAYYGISTTGPWGTGLAHSANSGSGSLVSATTNVNRLWVPEGYV